MPPSTTGTPPCRSSPPSSPADNSARLTKRSQTPYFHAHFSTKPDAFSWASNLGSFGAAASAPVTSPCTQLPKNRRDKHVPPSLSSRIPRGSSWDSGRNAQPWRVGKGVIGSKELEGYCRHDDPSPRRSEPVLARGRAGLAPTRRPTTSSPRSCALLAESPTARRLGPVRRLRPLADPPLWEIIEDEIRAIPPEVWDALPADLSAEHDHYVYGTPKRNDP